MTMTRIIVLFLIIGMTVAQKYAQHPVRQRVFPSRAGPDPIKAPEEVEDAAPANDKCPQKNGFFPDSEQCDRYYACTDGKHEARLCPDGMVFNDYDSDEEKCDLPYNLDCSKRPELQTPIPSKNCPRKNGYFGHKDKNICDTFYYCVDGKFNMITCPDGLVFNPKTGICTWPDEAGKLGCSSKDVFEFTCPTVNETEALTHPRYADPEDCQFFYVCINGDTPRRNGCKLGQVFDESTKLCDWARKVPDCADWYKDRLTDAQLDELENPKPKPRDPSRPTRPQRKRITRPTQPPVNEDIE
ncbi:protein obstructor-E isoform X1 [Episyrphus balteatus]|uniref:protein obstructor-E isoform X1 n=2 Tax=Episyrphus balteatus TaxID=286459 RepID=UPI00248520D0|nr:protein obstructor-E isoform X1 [Episyrphus balteatus]